MKLLSLPLFWLLFGCFEFPILCFALFWAGTLVIEAIGRPSIAAMGPQFGSSAAPGAFLGVFLGVISALAAEYWNDGQALIARALAGCGGVLIGGFWLSHLAGTEPMLWIAEFGFAIPPLIWSLALMLFGLLAKRLPPE